jgi:hypothetical protein
MSIAKHCLAMAGRQEQALEMATAIQRVQPGYRLDDFLSAFHYGSDADALMRQADRHVAGWSTGWSTSH